MTTEILIERGLRETRAAIVENGALQEVHIERVSRRGLVGNVYKGRVTRVLPGMQKSELLEIRAIASRDEGTASRAAYALGIPQVYGSYEALLADPDVIDGNYTIKWLEEWLARHAPDSPPSAAPRCTPPPSPARAHW